jgi:predicted transcriptional regulator
MIGNIGGISIDCPPIRHNLTIGSRFNGGKAMETKMLDAHIPLPLAARLDALAADLALPRDVIVAEAITTWLDSEERRRIATLRTLAAANTIVVVEHDRVIDWADSL